MPIDSWQHDLVRALETNDPEVMQKAIKSAPPAQIAAALQMIKDQGHGAFRARNYAEAVDLFNQLVLADTRDYFVLLHRTEALLHLDRLEEATAAGQHLLSLHPEYAKAHQVLGQIFLQRKDKPNALAALRQASSLDPKDQELARQVAKLQQELEETQKIMDRVFDPEKASAEDIELMPPPELPEISFHPERLLETPDYSRFKPEMVKGISHFLRNFSAMEAPRELIQRVEDGRWIGFWLELMQGFAGKRVGVCGTEAGLLPLHARKHGAKEIVCWDSMATTARLAQGTVHKNQLEQLRQDLAENWATMNPEDQKAAFAARLKPFQFLDRSPADLEPEKLGSACETFVVTELDHGLLGKGLVAAIQLVRSRFQVPDDQIFPNHVTIHAQPISWDYQAQGFDLGGLNAFRWSVYPRRIRGGGWSALGEAQTVASFDLVNFKNQDLECSFKVKVPGTLHGILFWFRIEANGLVLDSGPEGGLSSLGQAFQEVAARNVAMDQDVAFSLAVREDRLLFQALPAAHSARSATLPEWRYNFFEESVWRDVYIKAVQEMVSTNQVKSVLVIGAQTGEITMAAARAGARVYACEMSGNLCKALQENLVRNQLQDKVTVFHADCRSLKVGEHLPEKVDRIVFDDFDCGLLGNGIVHFLEYARENLANEGGCLPLRARILVQLIERRLDRLEGYDISLLTPYLFSEEYVRVNLKETPYRALSNVVELCEINFSSAKVIDEIHEFKAQIEQAGILGGIAIWYEIDLDEKVTLSSSPYEVHSYRGQAVQYLSEVRVDKGMTLALKCKNTSSNLLFAVNPEGLEDRLLSLPRFDPQWLKMQHGLNENNQQMMQHLRHSPASFAEAAEVALAFVQKPGEVQLSQAMAQRFYETFLNG